MLPKLLLAFVLLGTLAGTIASPLAARVFDGWNVIMLRRINTQQIAPRRQDVPEPGETWSVFVTRSTYFQAKLQPGENRPWQGTGINISPTGCSQRTGLVIARVGRYNFAFRRCVLRSDGFAFEFVAFKQ
ncbi:hypothetical protein F5876DRAFT_70316, partial [Lentinula aff. lateritia]